MEQITGIIQWIQSHWLEIGGIITSVIGIASIIVKLTPSETDNKILDKIIAFLSKYIALNKKP